MSDSPIPAIGNIIRTPLHEYKQLYKETRDIHILSVIDALFEEIRNVDRRDTQLRMATEKDVYKQMEELRRDLLDKLKQKEVNNSNKFQRFTKYINNIDKTLKKELENKMDYDDMVTYMVPYTKTADAIKNMNINLIDILKIMDSDVFKELINDDNAEKLLKFLRTQINQLETKFNEIDKNTQYRQNADTFSDAVSADDTIRTNTQYREGKDTFSQAVRENGPLIADTLDATVVENPNGTWSHLRELQTLVGHMVDPTVERMKEEIVRKVYSHKNFSQLDPKKINDALLKLEKITLTRNVSLDEMDDMLQKLKKDIKPLGSDINTLYETYIKTLKASLYGDMIGSNLKIPLSTPMY